MQILPRGNRPWLECPLWEVTDTLKAAANYELHSCIVQVVVMTFGAFTSFLVSGIHEIFHNWDTVTCLEGTAGPLSQPEDSRSLEPLGPNMCSWYLLTLGNDKSIHEGLFAHFRVSVELCGRIAFCFVRRVNALNKRAVAWLAYEAIYICIWDRCSVYSKFVPIHAMKAENWSGSVWSK